MFGSKKPLTQNQGQLNSTAISMSAPVHPLYPGSTHEFTISSRNVRDEIIKSLSTYFINNNLVKRIIEHMKKFAKTSLDNYSEFVIILTEFGRARLVFQTTRVNGLAADYLLDKYDFIPPEEFRKESTWRDFFGIKF